MKATKAKSIIVRNKVTESQKHNLEVHKERLNAAMGVNDAERQESYRDAKEQI